MDIIQNAFNGGEMSPLLAGRSDIPKYATGGQTYRNMIPCVTGPVRNRPGIKYLGATKDSSKKSRLIPFKYGTTQNFVLESGSYYFRPWLNDANIAVTAAVLSDFSAAISYPVDYHVKVGHYISFDYSGKKLQFIAPYGLANSNTIKVATQANTGDTLSVTAAGDTITVKFANTTASKNAANLIRAQLKALGTVNGVDVSGWLMCANTAYVTSPVITGTKAATAHANGNKLYICKLASSYYGSGLGNFFPPVETTYWTEFTSGNPVETTTPYTETCVPNLKFVQSADVMFLVCPGHSPKQLTRYDNYNWILSEFPFKNGPFMPDNLTSTTITPSGTTGSITLTASSGIFVSGHVGSWWRISTGIVQVTAYTDSLTVTATVKSTLPGTSAYADWAEGSWSTYRGWPSSITFYGDRLIFAGTPSEPQTIWASQIGDYVNFGVSSPLVATDAITIPLNSSAAQKIQSLSNLGAIMALTDAGVWYVGPIPGGDGTFTPTSNFAKQTAEGGSNSVNPAIIKNQGVFVHFTNAEVSYVEYNENSGGLVSGSVSTLSDHLLKNHTFSEMAFQRKPEPIAWLVRDDGIIVGYVINAEQQISAAFWCETKRGNHFFESVCVIPGSSGYDEVYFVIQRNSARYIEKLGNWSESTDAADHFFVDSGVTLNNPITISAVTLASPAVITATTHGLSNGDTVDFSGIIWADDIDRFENETQPDQLNGRQYTVTGATTNTFSVIDEYGVTVDSTSWNTYRSGGYVRKAVTTVSGLDHLEGKEVAILANGSVMGNKTVSSGSITLDSPASRVHVGLPYVSDWESNAIEIMTQGGTSRMKKLTVNPVVINFYNSGGGYAGDFQTFFKGFNSKTEG